MSDNTTSIDDSKYNSTTEDTIWNDLVEWVQGGPKQDSSNNPSGYVHPALTLRGAGPSRGVISTAAIAKGELLIRISSDHVLSGATETVGGGETGKVQASPWLRCVGAFLKAKRNTKNQEGDGNFPPLNYHPYLNSLPTFEEYETLHNWSSETNEVESFLKGTTLGNLVSLDRSTKGTQTRYRNTVEPYLIKVGAIDEIPTGAKRNADENDGIETSAGYRAFLEASMCISTRGFHLLPTATPTKSREGSTKSYDGPFLLPIIDLLNHDPQHACTTLRRYHSTETNGGSYFAMMAERDIVGGEEIFHSYGSDMTSAQLLQTFGFVPGNHSTEALAAAAAEKPTHVSKFSTPVGLSARDHLVAASRAVKASSFPDTLIDRIRSQSEQSTNGDEEYDEDDSFWEVCDIPDRLKMTSNEEFLISASQARCDDDEPLLSEDIVTLMAAQFLPEDAFDEIFPTGENTLNEVLLDLSILTEDYYLGMLVCKSLLVALFLKARDYTLDTGAEEGNDKTVTEDPRDLVMKAISAATPSGVVGKYISSLVKKESSRIQTCLHVANSARTTAELREIYGCTIRIEELTNLFAFCSEIEGLMARLSLDDNTDADEDPGSNLPRKRARVE